MDKALYHLKLNVFLQKRKNDKKITNLKDIFKRKKFNCCKFKIQHEKKSY